MRKLLLAFAFGLGLLAPAIAQPVVNNQISGNECWNAGQGPGGPSQFLCINQVRNGAAMDLVSGSGSATSTATQQTGTLMWVGTAPTTWTITFPSLPFDGQIITLGTDTTLTTLVTVTAGSGTTLNATYTNQTLTAVTSVAFQYDTPTLKWYRLR